MDWLVVGMQLLENVETLEQNVRVVVVSLHNMSL